MQLQERMWMDAIGRVWRGLRVEENISTFFLDTIFAGLDID